jgi:hypothetical protein
LVRKPFSGFCTSLADATPGIDGTWGSLLCTSGLAKAGLLRAAL